MSALEDKIAMKPLPPIKVLVVDDSSFVRKSLIRMFDAHQDIRIIDVASDGQMALEKIKALQPDVVTLDIQMPVMDGLTALSRIMLECPVPVIMLSSLTDKGGENTLRALELGAVDFVDKSAAGGNMNIATLTTELAAKILMAAGVDLHKMHERHPVTPFSPLQRPIAANSSTELVLIGTSTGGPPALQTILEMIPGDFPCPVVIVQHMPVGFTASLAERLNKCCALTVKEGEDKEVLRVGNVYIAPAGQHLIVLREGEELKISLDENHDRLPHCPSVDVLFHSAAEACGNRSLAVVMTGMGRDGAMGAQAIKRFGGRVVIESETSAIVYGMPKAVEETVTVDACVHLEQLCATIVKMVT